LIPSPPAGEGWGEGYKELDMGFIDIVLMVVIIAGACYLLYHSLWKKKGHCTGCDSGTCNSKKD
jgi:hypothetical protein